jgi:hypothetical protein
LRYARCLVAHRRRRADTSTFVTQDSVFLVIVEVGAERCFVADDRRGPRRLDGPSANRVEQPYEAAIDSTFGNRLDGRGEIAGRGTWEGDPEG